MNANKYTYDFISNNWKKEKNLITNDLVVADKYGDDIDLILLNKKEFIDNYEIEDKSEIECNAAVNESIFDKLINKAKQDKKPGISAAEYVASETRYTNKAKSDQSFYDKTHIIEITLDNGNTVKGIIRISVHQVDLQKWAEHNTNYDFGISFVIKETTSEWCGNDIVEIPNRNICIFEYVYEYDRTNIRALDILISEILGIKHKRDI